MRPAETLDLLCFTDCLRGNLSSEPGVVSGWDELTDAPDLQDPERARL